MIRSHSAFFRKNVRTDGRFSRAPPQRLDTAPCLSMVDERPATPRGGSIVCGPINRKPPFPRARFKGFRMKSKMAPPTPEAAFKPPAHLSADSAGFWKRTQAEFGIKDDAGQKLLTLACEMLDRAADARRTIAKEGQTYCDRFGAPRVHPAVAIERNSVLAFTRALRELNLEPKQTETVKTVSSRDRGGNRP